jgi:AcrR family transcriptional regulator
MPRLPLARERALDAFETILLADGERSATLEATAKAAGISKGGLLYHFASKDELAEGMLERTRALVELDVTRMKEAPEGPVAYYVRTSVMEDDALDRALIATTRLAQGGHPGASAALRDVRTRWADTLRPHVRDDTALDLVLLVGDGLYYNNSLDGADADNALSGPVPTGAALDALVELVARMTA